MFSHARIPLAWLLLTHRKSRLLTSVAGVSFAAILMFTQMGFLHGIFDTQTQTIPWLNGDLFLISTHKESVTPCRPFPRRRLLQARAAAGVTAAYPLYMLEFGGMYKGQAAPRQRGILVWAFNPEDPVFLIPEILDQARLLKAPNTALIDSKSRPFYGEMIQGRDAELTGRTVHIRGVVPLGTDFRANGNLLVSDQTFFNCFANPVNNDLPTSQVEFGLIKLCAGADVVAVQKALRARLPDDVLVLTKQELINRVIRFWATAQPIGFVFILGTVVGFFIGVTICYQILYTDIMDHLPQYATLKAMGYATPYLVRVVLQEATYLGLLGFFPGLLAAFAAYAALEFASGMLIRLTFARAILVLVLTVLMCCVSAVLALSKLIRSDPAEVFS